MIDLVNSQHHVIAVYTQPDRPSGRGRKLAPSAVKTVALKNNINVYQPVNFKNSSDIEILEQLNADIMIVVAYGLILPKAILQAPAKGCLNIHGSILPKWRGAAPIQRAILAGDKETGVTIMQMDKGLDTGDMLTIHRCPIEANDTASSLHDKLAVLGSQALLHTLKKIPSNKINAIPQDNSLSTYAKKITKQEGRIDWIDLPIFGYLFKTQSESEQRRELMLIITPTIIGPDTDTEKFGKDFSSQFRTVGWYIENELIKKY